MIYCFSREYGEVPAGECTRLWQLKIIGLDTTNFWYLLDGRIIKFWQHSKRSKVSETQSNIFQESSHHDVIYKLFLAVIDIDEYLFFANKNNMRELANGKLNGKRFSICKNGCQSINVCTSQSNTCCDLFLVSHFHNFLYLPPPSISSHETFPLLPSFSKSLISDFTRKNFTWFKIWARNVYVEILHRSLRILSDFFESVFLRQQS